MRTAQTLLLLAALSSYCTSQTGMFPRTSADSLASALYAEGNYWKLMELSRQFPPDSFSAKFHFHLGMSYAALSEPLRAQDHLKRSIALDSSALQYRYQYARILSQSGQFTEAVRQLQSCIAMDSNFIPARFQLGLTYAAQKEHPQEEMAVFSHLIGRNPKDFLSLHHLGEALKRSGDPDSAAQYWRRALSINPRYVPALISLSNYLSAQKRFSDALPLYLTADSVRGGNKDLVFQIGECYRKLGDIPSAILYFKRAIALDSSNGLYHAQLAYAYFTEERFDSSAASYRQALVYDHENPQYYLNLALVYSNMDSTAQVLRSYADAARVLHPEVTANVYYDLGSFCFRKKLWRDGIEAFQRALEMNPLLVNAYYFKGSCHMQLNEHQAALPLFMEFLSRSQDDPERKGERYSAQKMVEYIKAQTRKK